MSIDIETERTILLAQSPKHIPGRPNASTPYRWATEGVKVPGSDERIRLETIKVGGKRFTSLEAIQRFIERTTRNSPGASAPVPRPTTRQREAAIRQAERELERAGV